MKNYISGEVFSKTSCTINDFNLITKEFKGQIGSHNFETGTLSAASNFCNELSEYHDSKVVQFVDKDNNVLMRGMGFVKNVKEYVDVIVAGRAIQNPQLTIGADSGQKKMVITLSVTEQDATKSFCSQDHKPGSTESIFVIGTASIEKIILNVSIYSRMLPDYSKMFQIILD